MALDDFLNRELTTMEIILWHEAMRSAITLDEYVQVRLTQGATKAVIEMDLLRDLEEGGRIFGEFRNSIRATAIGSAHRTRDAAEFDELGVIEDYRWVAVLINTCKDCLARHAKIKSWEEWELEGLPRTGATVCKEHCKCMLIPAENTEVEPIQRGRK